MNNFEFECCNRFFHKDFSYTVQPDGTLLITPDTTQGASSICNREPFDLRLCRCLPLTITTPLQVLILVNGVQVPVLDKFGNLVYSNQLKLRKVYRGSYGTDTPHVIFYNEYGN